jgi:dolichol-phosphate mannosyltransferase
MATETKKVVIIVPTYNEKGNIEQLVSLLNHHIFPQIPKQWLMEVLVVDDSSPDGTADLVKQLKKTHDNLHLKVNPVKAGLGNAYLKGMNYAINTLKAEVVFEFDADLQHDPNKIPVMLKKIDEGYDLVLGSRYIPGGGIPKNWGFNRKFLSIFGNIIIRTVITHFAIHDWTTGYRAIKANVVKDVLPELDYERFMGYTFQIGFLHKAVRKGYAITEVPFVFKDRKIGKSKLGSEYIKNTLLYILKVRIKEIIGSRIFKFMVVGVIGAIVQLTSLQLLRTSLTYQWSYFVSVELAVLSNFIWSNIWTFHDRTLPAQEIPVKFLQFNLASAGSIAIQQVLAFLGERYLGIFYLFTLPLLPIRVDTGLLIAVIGILIGMFWNFFAYSKIIWRAKASPSLARGA